jgi:hypothetical protein
MNPTLALILGTALLWAATTLPAGLALDARHLTMGSVAAVVCLVPSTLTLVWSRASLRRPPEERVLAALGGVAVRIVAAAGGGVGAYFLVAELREKPYWFCLWILVFYLGTLVVETALVVRDARRPDGPPPVPPQR